MNNIEVGSTVIIKSNNGNVKHFFKIGSIGIVKTKFLDSYYIECGNSTQLVCTCDFELLLPNDKLKIGDEVIITTSQDDRDDCLHYFVKGSVCKIIKEITGRSIPTYEVVHKGVIQNVTINDIKLHKSASYVDECELSGGFLENTISLSSNMKRRSYEYIELSTESEIKFLQFMIDQSLDSLNKQLFIHYSDELNKLIGVNSQDGN